MPEAATEKIFRPVGYYTHFYVSAVIGLSALTLAAVLGTIALRPEADNTSIIATIIGVTSPAQLAFIGLAVKEVYLSTNSRLTQLVELTGKAEFARGQLDRPKQVDNFLSGETEK